MTDLTALRALATAATPGPWCADYSEMYEDGEPTCLYRAMGPASGVEHDTDACDAAAEQAQRDAAFMAAASPTTVIALLDALEAADAVATAAADEMALAHEWRRRATEAEAALVEARAALAQLGTMPEQPPPHGENTE